MQTVFLPGEERLAYLRGEPADDDRFVGVAKTLLPDVLSYDPRRPVSFPHNGRTLTDDVVDLFFSLYTDGKVTGDKVGPHGALLDEFPYLGPPHEVSAASVEGPM